MVNKEIVNKRLYHGKETKENRSIYLPLWWEYF